MLPFGPRREKTCLWGFANNKSADQPMHHRFLKSIISILALSEILIFYLVSVAEEILALSETQKTGFVTTRPILNLISTHAFKNAN